MHWSENDRSSVSWGLERGVVLTVLLAITVTLFRHVTALSDLVPVARDAIMTVPAAAAAVWLAARARQILGVTSKLVTAAIVSLALTLLLVPLELLFPTGSSVLVAQPVVLVTTLLVMSFALPAAGQPARGLFARLLTLVAVTLLATMQVNALPQAAADTGGTDATGGCATAPKRTYNVQAINLDITINRFGDHDPFGFMYALTDKVAEIRAQEAALKANAAAGSDGSGAKVSSGLRQDPIQPLVLRGRLGECVVVNLANKLTDPPHGGPGFGDVPISTQPGGVPSVSVDMAGVTYDPAAGGQAVGNNPTGVMVPPGGTHTYQYYLDPLLGEGAHVFHSGGDSNQLTAHGLFGTLVAEPSGSTWLDPETGADRTNDSKFNSFSAIIKPGSGVTFREFVIMYHEIGDEQFAVRRPAREDGGDTNCFDDPDGLGSPLPMRDEGGVNNCGTDTESYRPGSRALNYRSEPFFRRQELLVQTQGADDTTLPASESLIYGSYMNGDPATPIPRSYLGEPTKTRLVHAGWEQLHVHHLHGGGDRWPMNPAAAPGNFGTGLQKNPPVNPQSINLDSQTVGPSESYTLQHECSAGGCQQAPGDFLYHCHIAHHYIAGMWGIWRVFDTRQSDLAVIPGRTAPPTAVTSQGLIGKTVEGKTVVAKANLTNPSTQVALEDLVESEIPPPGVPADKTDATVLDWTKGGTAASPLYLNEPDDTAAWVNYASPTPGQRNPIKFNPLNGRPAYPMLQPHLGARPPFAPNGHSGAPYLGNTASPTRPDGLCPANAPVKTYNITAISTPIRETQRETDQNGEIYVLNQDKNAVLSGQKAADPLVIRSNVGDCVAITFSSELNPAVQQKVNMHTHFVQFDPQGSDGVITGFNYETSVYANQRTPSTLSSVSGNKITVSSAAGLRPGISVAVGAGRANIEIRKITAISGTTLTLDSALGQSHAASEPVSVEYVQYRWYSDVDSGTVFWHDHVQGIQSWGHGLFAAHIIEPKGSTYHDPKTGALIQSGTMADIYTTSPVGANVSSDFREYMVFLGNGRRGRPELANPALGRLDRNAGQECEEGAINLRAAPLGERSSATDQRQEFNGTLCRNATSSAQDPNGNNTAAATVTTVDPYVFSSAKYGDPGTPLLRAYAGDPVVIRTIGVNDRVEGLRLQGHRFAKERFNADAELMDASTTGISERFDYVLDGGAGGPGHFPGDYLYYSTRNFAFESGAWGIFRVHDRLQSDLKPLPDRTSPASGTGFPIVRPNSGTPPPASQAGVVSNSGSPCAVNAPTRDYDVTVFNKALPTAPNADQDGIVYALTSDVSAIKSGAKAVEPLVLRANQGDCLRVTVRNQIAAGSKYGGARAGFDLGKLPYNPQTQGGGAVGLNPDTTVAAGQTIQYRFTADKNLGTAIFQNLGSMASMRHGAYGLVVVEPNGSSWFNSLDGRPLTATNTSTQAIIRASSGNFREFALTMGTTDQQYARSIFPYQDVVAGTGVNSQFPGDPPVATLGYNQINYTSAPLTTRLSGTSPDYGKAFSSAKYGEPATPVLETFAGDPVVFRVGIGASDQFHTFTVSGHMFPQDPNLWNGTTDKRSQLLTSKSLTAAESLDVELVGGAGPYCGDYLYGDARQPFTEAGLWGVLRVLPGGTTALAAIQ
ncbi:hypothetical protein [Actinocrispum wychmicini]|uniref:Multicopper oxidase n=1 Tax=Actinocrispum wychmicini TaxID=1213861 RepID=A0A4R2IN07_9PSEU|nr:hypothetical protein [Actinocrispum wychmicini]TCO46621.1 hypothetical protein EV192_11816 [Actinocrispum wychmicini]